MHFKLVAPPDTDAALARELVRMMRRRAQGFPQRGHVLPCVAAAGSF